MTTKLWETREERSRTLNMYARLGILTVPLLPREKKPMHADWQRGSPLAWAGAPLEANVGVLAGRPSGDLVVLDFDAEEVLVSVLGLAPRELAAHTLVAKTRRGWHVYVRHPGVETCIPREGFSALSTGSLAVAPPSIHPSGVAYRFVGEPRRVAQLTSLASVSIFLPPEPVRSGGNTTPTPAPQHRGGGGIEAAHRRARSRPAAGKRPDCWTRVEAWMARQSPRLRESWATLQANAPEGFDRSRADFAVALSLSEGDFTEEEAVAVLLALPGSKASERGEAYARRTVGRAFDGVVRPA